MTIPELETLISEATKTLGEKKDAARKKAIEEAEAKLAEVGLSFADMQGQKTKKKAAATFKAVSGHMYQHPDNPSLKCAGVGKRPAWWYEVLSAGKTPIDLGAAK